MPENIFSLSFVFILSKVPGDHVSARVGKLYVRDTRDDLGEERSVGWILGFLEHLGVAITESRLKQQEVRGFCSVRRSKKTLISTCRMSHSLMVPLLELYTNRLHSFGWNSEAVMTSVSSSMLAGLMSTMLNDWSVISMCQRLMRRSSAER